METLTKNNEAKLNELIERIKGFEARGTLDKFYADKLIRDTRIELAKRSN